MLLISSSSSSFALTRVNSDKTLFLRLSLSSLGRTRTGLGHTRTRICVEQVRERETERKRERGRVREMPISIPAVAGTAATSPMKQAKLVQILNLTETRTASKMLHSLRRPSTRRLLYPSPFVVFQTMCNALENTCFRFFFFVFCFSAFPTTKVAGMHNVCARIPNGERPT